MQIIFWVIIFAFAAFGAWTAANRVSDWINRAEPVEYPTPPPDTPWPKEVVAKRQPRKTRPKTPSGKTARKRSTKSGK